MNIQIVRILLITAMITVHLGISGCTDSQESSVEGKTAVEPALELQVKAVPVRLEDWKNTVPISGNLRTQSIVDVKAEVGGRLIEANVDEGDLVRKGDLLATVDDTNYQLAYRQAAAALKVSQVGIERARVSAEYAVTEKERADNLLKTGGITQKDHQAAITGMKEAETQVKLAEAQCLQAEAAVAITEKALKDCSIYAPSDGHVQKRWIDKGSLLNPGSAIFTIVDNSKLELECVVPSYYLPDIRTGQKADFNTPSWGEKIFSGFVASINPMIQTENRSVILKLEIKNQDLQLRTGMYARGFITTGIEKNVPVISRDTLIPEEEISEFAHVYVVEDGIAKRRKILLGGKGQDRVWVQEGLVEGELLIVERGPALKEGRRVQIVVDSTDFGS